MQMNRGIRQNVVKSAHANRHSFAIEMLTVRAMALALMFLFIQLRETHIRRLHFYQSIGSIVPMQ